MFGGIFTTVWSSGQGKQTSYLRQKAEERGLTVPDLGHFVTGAEGVTKKLTEVSDMQGDGQGTTRDDKIKGSCDNQSQTSSLTNHKGIGSPPWDNGGSH